MVDIQADKLHAACDECRTRKLKCSGTQPQCTRCGKEKIQCVYSPQKPMGRPRKRRRDERGEQSEHVDEQISQIPTPATDSFVLTALFDDSGVTPSFDDFSRFDAFVTDEGFSGSLLPPYVESTNGNGFEQGATHDMNFDPNPIDPSLWNPQTTTPTIPLELNNQTTTPTSLPQQQQQQLTDTNTSTTLTPTTPGSCSCFSLMFLTTTDLQSITSFSFPRIIPRLRDALITTSSIIHCPHCPTQTLSSIQNVTSLSTLLSTLADRYHKVLDEIHRETLRAAAAAEKKPFRVGDSSPELRHLHTGTPDCPMGFSISIEPRDWGKMCKAALKTEVLGGGANEMTLVRLLDEMEGRQRRWHADEGMYTEERIRMFGAKDDCRQKPEAALCLRSIESVRGMVRGMDWGD